VFDSFASQSVVAWYNRLLAREPWASAALAPHGGSTARIDAGLVSVFLAVSPRGMLAVGTGTPSVTITLEPAALAGSLWNPAAALRDVRVSGDAAFAQVLTDVLQKLKPDPAEDLARWVGDAPAERIVRTVNAGLVQLREAGERAARQGADYLVGENPLLLGRPDWTSFTQELNALRDRLAVLEQRVGALPHPGGRGAGT
jgi:ubiquinone biosynthesis protein UbiJ